MSIKAQDEIRPTSITLIPMQLQDLISKERAPVCKLWGPFQDVDYPPQKSCLQCHSAYLVVSQSSKAPHIDLLGDAILRRERKKNAIRRSRMPRGIKQTEQVGPVLVVALD